MTSAERYIGVDELINSDEYSHRMEILRQFLLKILQMIPIGFDTMFTHTVVFW